MKVQEIGDKNYPKMLRQIKNPPTKLYIKGNESVLNDFSIAIVGTRNCSEYGKEMAIKFAKELTEYGINIVSGMAKGVDTFAHKGCLEIGGKTIAVLPCGFNCIYPKENEKLYTKIIESGGAVISEYEPNIKASYNNFLERNRIVSGLSSACLVIEAGKRSGTSVTARYTKEQNKNVFCIPSSLENPKGVGTNGLIKKGAKLITTVDDIFKEFPNMEFKKRKIMMRETNVNQEYLEIYKLLSNKPIHINEIYKKSKLSIQEINYKLMMLEIEDCIIQLSGMYFIRK